MTDTNLYFIAIIPPEPMLSEGMAMKNHFANKYNSKASLNSPPHITLHMPFKLKSRREDELLNALQEFVKDKQPVDLLLKNFGAFPPRVIFIDMEDSDELHNLFVSLMKMMKINFNQFNADYKNRGFNPHITLAFRDLKRDMFKEAWSEFKNKEYKASFTAVQLTLLKHNGKHWERFKEFELQQ